ncbi:MAG: hypothetical protein B7Y39_18645 [Bdellovibrio sp. 28-41-41]|nr:MAG: hypothetical protein B7Y39_18645 [Bdellovibrio sp. 28-41-41]
MNTRRFEGFPVVAYDLSEYESVLKPFCDWIISEEGQEYTLGEDYESGRKNIWEQEIPVLKLMAAVFDMHCLQFLNEEHPDFKGKQAEYILKKDAWLTTPSTKQHIRIHTHLPPFIREEDVGELITVFYVHLDSSINRENGAFELYRSPEETPAHVWVPKQFSLLLMPPNVWHRARPFTGRRYSLATDIKIITA